MKLACVKRGAPPAQLWQGTRSALCDFSGIENRLGGLPNSMRARRERLEQLAFQFPFRAQREAIFLAFSQRQAPHTRVSECAAQFHARATRELNWNRHLSNSPFRAQREAKIFKKMRAFPLPTTRPQGTLQKRPTRAHARTQTRTRPPAPERNAPERNHNCERKLPQKCEHFPYSQKSRKSKNPQALGSVRPRGNSLPRATARPREKRPREKPQSREKTAKKMRAFPLPTGRP